MDEQADASEAALALQAGHQVVGQLDVFQRAAQDELAGVEDELLVALYFDFLSQVGLGLAHVNVGAPGV